MSTGQALTQVSQVAPAISRLSGGVTNFYLIEDGGKLTVVDAGTPADWALLQRALAARGKPAGDVEAVLLTHAHADHTGFAERARTEAGARVWVHRADAAVAKGAKPGTNDGGMARYLLRAEFYRTTLSLMRRGGAKIVPVLEVSVFGDGEVLDVPGRPRVIHAPRSHARQRGLVLRPAPGPVQRRHHKLMASLPGTGEKAAHTAPAR